jgi:hypothetical protein
MSPFLEHLHINKKEHYHAYNCIANPIKFEAMLHVYSMEEYVARIRQRCDETGPGMCIIYENETDYKFVIQVTINENLSELVHKYAFNDITTNNNKYSYAFYYCDNYRGDNMEYCMKTLKNVKQLIKRGNNIKKQISYSF